MKPEELRIEMEKWLRDAGIEKVIGRDVRLKNPPQALLDKAAKEDAIIVVQPAGCTAAQLSEVFNMTNWASAGLDTVSVTPAANDEWFASPASDLAPYLGESPENVEKIATRESKKGMSLEQYILFAARFKALRGHYPDVSYWTWLLRSFERSLVLFAGFDTHGNLQINSCTPDYVDDNTGCRLVTVEAA